MDGTATRLRAGRRGEEPPSAVGATHSSTQNAARIARPGNCRLGRVHPKTVLVQRSPFDPASYRVAQLRASEPASPSVFLWRPNGGKIRVPSTYASSPHRDGADPGGDGDGGSRCAAVVYCIPRRALPHEDAPVDRSAPCPVVGLAVEKRAGVVVDGG